jgi:hypothetical protein
MNKLITSILILSLFIVYTSFSQVSFGFQFGLSTPNDKINDIWNRDNLKDVEGLGRIWRDGTKLGFNLGLGLRVPLSKYFMFTAGAGWNMFPKTEIIVKDPTDSLNKVTLETKQNVFPLSVGVNGYFINSDFLGIYAVGNLSYNLIANSVNYLKGDIPIPLEMTPTDSRIGCGFGAGFDFDLKVLMLNLEVKYNITNLIGKVGDEQTKAYLSVDLGVYFGRVVSE